MERKSLKELKSSTEIFQELKKLQYESDFVYDLWLKETDINKKQELNTILDNYDIQDEELKNQHHKLFQQECYDRHIQLLNKYNNHKYRIAYRNGTIEFVNHRKDINYSNVVSAMQLMRKENCYVSECNAISISEDEQCYTYYDDDKINSVKGRQIYIKGKIVTEEIYRNNFRCIIGYNYCNSILEFYISNNISVKYYKTNSEGKCMIELVVGSKYKQIDIVCKEHMDKIKSIIKQLKKDKFIDVEHILNYFDVVI